MTEGGDRSIYRSVEGEKRIMSLYEDLLGSWPCPYSERRVSTRYGSVAVIESGDRRGEPLLLLHASSMASVSWAPNVAALSEEGFRVLAVDYIGEAGRSVLDDIDIFPKTTSEIGALYGEIADRLEIERGPVVAASAGGHAAMRYALVNPERVSKLVLLGPMGITRLGARATLRMVWVNLFPSPRRTERTTRWALGESNAVPQAYRDWFAAVLAGIGSPPRVGAPKRLGHDELSRLTMPVMLVLGDQDPLVGDPGRAADRAASIPDLRVELLESGHLLGIERAEEVDHLLADFLSGE